MSRQRNAQGTFVAGSDTGKRGAEIRRRRQEASCSREALAHLVGVHRITIFNAERDACRPATVQKIVATLDSLDGWLDPTQAAEQIGISDQTVVRVTTQYLRQKHGRTRWPDGTEVTAKLCGADLRVRFGRLHGPFNVNRSGKNFRCFAADVAQAKKNHARLVKRLAQIRIVDGVATDDRGEQWLTSGEAATDPEIWASRDVLKEALRKSLGGDARSVHELPHAIAAVRTLRIRVFERAVRVTPIPSQNFPGRVLPGYNRKDLLVASAAEKSKPTAFSQKDVAELFGISDGRLSQYKDRGAPIDLEHPNRAAFEEWLGERRKDRELPLVAANGKLVEGNRTFWTVPAFARKYAAHIKTKEGMPTKWPEEILRARIRDGSLGTEPKRVRVRAGLLHASWSARSVRFIEENEGRQFLGLVKPKRERGQPKRERGRPRDREVADRRDRVEEAWIASDGTATAAELAKALNIDRLTVKNDLKAIRARG